jgi:hypothetical protein
MMSTSGDSLYSLSASDSKYPSGIPGAFSSLPRGVVAYAYDPLEDSPNDDQDDLLHDHAYKGRGNHFPWRGVANVSALLVLIVALLLLFIFYPVRDFLINRARSEKIVDGNVRINSTGQAPVLSVFFPFLLVHPVLLSSPSPFFIFLLLPPPCPLSMTDQLMPCRHAAFRCRN